MYLRIAGILILFWLSVSILGCAGTVPGSQSAKTQSSPGKSAGGEEEKKKGPVLGWRSSDLKVGYIRSDVLTSKYTEYRDADNSLKRENRKWLDQAEDMEKEIQTKERELEDLALILSEERKREKTDALTELRKELQKFRQDTWYAENSDYIKKRKELMEPIDARVNDAIWKVAEALELDIVFDTVSGNILFVKPEFDITNEVLEELED